MRNNYCYLLKIHLKNNQKSTNKQAFNLSTIALDLLPSKDPYLFPPDPQLKRCLFANLLRKLPSYPTPIAHYKRIQAQIVVSGFQSDTFLINILLNLYSRYDKLGDASKLFDEMPKKNLVSWSTMVSMYTRHGYIEKALALFLEFRRNCCKGPNEYILASVIRACMQMGDGGKLGVQIHDFVFKCGFDQDVYVGTCLVDFYMKSGCIDEARLVFDGLKGKNAVTWTIMITGYMKSGKAEVALQLFRQRKATDVMPDRYVLSSVLSACSVLNFIQGGKQVHCHVLRRGDEMDVSVINVLIDFYCKCGKVKAARRLFDEMTARNVISWTTMIAGYMQNSFNREAMNLFSEMTRLGWKADAFACTSVLTSCGSLNGLDQGRQVHAYTIKDNLESDDFVANALIDMYAKCSSLIDARRAFDIMGDQNVVSYNAMIEGYSSLERLSEALELFHNMRRQSLQPSLLTFVSLLGVSAALCTIELSRQIHTLIIRFGVSLDLFVRSSLIDVYSKCSHVKEARLLFEEMKEKDIVVWNALFFGYTQQLENEETLKLFSKLQLSRQKPNEFTFAALMTASSNLASLQHGQQFHTQLIKHGLDSDPFVTNAIIDMYAKCGSFEDACKTFNTTTWRDIVCWNSMISTYAHHGEAEGALQIFKRMLKEGMKPNYVTFVGLLSACVHAGFVELGLQHFESMPTFGVEPGIEHYACVVSLLGHAGKLYEAKALIESVPIKPAAVLWRTLLSSCRIVGNVELGRYAAERAISIDPMDSGSYTLLSNIFASKGMWADVKRVREKMDLEGVLKEPGCSWIEVNNENNVFIARDRTHHDSGLIYLVLDNLIMHIKGAGYVPDIAIPVDD
ncbi:pentatricopeptide repeat-containing protein At4g39530 [Gossypium arboreum]|uniref:Pentatricopeptide repeat-containing protein At4g39530 n=1 Tax=Gossypium arboreum TaxID=29729 RepID=A0ABR0Q6F4_GOSAR|nr:pentatricopeptide repeat-containing protein At4g39530 [Gossypium arboreum]KAK5834573.1 hypothetical protein PVK06_018455 [Gossypium arboreum]